MRGLLTVIVMSILIGSSVAWADSALAALQAQMQDRYVIADVSQSVDGRFEACKVLDKLWDIDTSSAKTYEDAWMARHNRHPCK